MITDSHLNERQNRLDRLQLVALAGLMIIGTMFVYSATVHSSVGLPWYDQNWFRQIIWYALGLAGAAAMCFVDYHIIARWSFVIYWAMIFCLVAVLIPHIGKTHGWGARRWIDLPFFQFHPSEFPKMAFILAMANFLTRPPEELRQPAIFWKGMGLM